MNVSGSLSPQEVSELVLANRVIRAPYHRADHDNAVRFTDTDRGLQWGADTIPALQGLFRVDRDPRDDRPDGWVGFARHWRGAVLRLEFDLFGEPGEQDLIMVVTGVFGRAGDDTLEADDFGEIELPTEIPTEEEWQNRSNRYQAARRKDDTDGTAAVHAYIASLPGWKREIATQFDEIIESVVPDVRRAVKWHQPFYGVEDRGWFAAFSAFTKHVKLAFVADSYLEPEPPTGTSPDGQALNLEESDTLDEEQVGSWIRQAADNPGMNW